jgi:sugar lactone lactonase YvrE
MKPLDCAVTPLPATGRAELGEGPVWDHRTRRLHWVDITRGRIHWLDTTDPTAVRGTCEVAEMVGFAAPTADPAVWAVGLKSGLGFVRLPSGPVTRFAAPEPDLPDNRFNDGKPDPAGHLWGGTMVMRGGGRTGSLYRVDGNLHVARQFDGVGISNGLAWHAGRRAFYYIDTPTLRIDRFDWDAASGAISGRRSFVEFDPSEGRPDGMTIDAEGHLWIAFWGGWGLQRRHGETGELLARLTVPAERTTSCAFGGEDFGTLYITTASIGMKPEEFDARQPFAGHVFACRPGVHGLPTDLFAGRPPPE